MHRRRRLFLIPAVALATVGPGVFWTVSARRHGVEESIPAHGFSPVSGPKLSANDPAGVPSGVRQEPEGSLPVDGGREFDERPNRPPSPPAMGRVSGRNEGSGRQGRNGSHVSTDARKVTAAGKKGAPRLAEGAPHPDPAALDSPGPGAPLVVPYRVDDPGQAATIPAVLAAESEDTGDVPIGIQTDMRKGVAILVAVGEGSDKAIEAFMGWRLADAFVERVATGTGDPADPVYQRQWAEAQEESDAAMRASLGGHIWLAKHREAHHQAWRESGPAAEKGTGVR